MTPQWKDAPDSPGLWLRDRINWNEPDAALIGTADLEEWQKITEEFPARWFGPIPNRDTPTPDTDALSQRIEFLEKALSQARDSFKLVMMTPELVKVTPNYIDSRAVIGKKCILQIGYSETSLHGTTEEYPELAAWLKEKEDKIEVIQEGAPIQKIADAAKKRFREGKTRIIG